MNHHSHLAEVMTAIAEERPVPMCPDCEAIVATFTVAGLPVEMESPGR